MLQNDTYIFDNFTVGSSPSATRLDGVLGGSGSRSVKSTSGAPPICNANGVKVRLRNVSNDTVETRRARIVQMDELLGGELHKYSVSCLMSFGVESRIHQTSDTGQPPTNVASAHILSTRVFECIESIESSIVKSE